jgi:hypothetical protein
MRAIFNRIKNSEFLTFNEVLRLKVAIVTVFLFAFTALAIPQSTYNDFSWDIDIFVPVGFALLLMLTILLLAINLNRWAMHFSIYSIAGLTLYYVSGSTQFYGYILFFVALTVIIFYQDILTYLIYGMVVTGYGVLYISQKGDLLVGINSTNADVSILTYQTILIVFYVIFLIQFIVSDSIYEKLNNEWVRMNKVVGKYQEFTLENLKEIIEKNNKEPIYKNTSFHQAVNEISIFINEFFEEDAGSIAELVEFYFFLHEQDVDKIIEDEKVSSLTRKYASQLSKYLLNRKSELVSILFDFSTLFKGDDKYSELRYEYNLDNMFDNKIDKLLSLSILYKYLKSECTQIDKYGKVNRILTHEEIVELFVSKEFREFISYEQVNFFLDNQELYREFL